MQHSSFNHRLQNKHRFLNESINLERMAENILVIGGAGGIGSAIVEKYEKSGATGLVGDLAYSQPCQHSQQTYHFPVDVTKPESVLDLAHRLEGYPITHFVSLAGGARNEFCKGIAEVTTAVIDESIKLNLTSHIYLMHAFVPLMGGEGDRSITLMGDRSITLVSSINAIQDWELPAYSAAKAGLLGLVYATTTELGARGIRVNAILPGTVPTDRTHKEPKDFEALLKTSALNRLTTPQEVANAVYATTHLLTAMTGQTLVVDCGQTVKTIRYTTDAKSQSQ